MQLRVLWEEILPRFHSIEVLEAPMRTRSNLIRGIQAMQVKTHRDAPAQT